MALLTSWGWNFWISQQSVAAPPISALSLIHPAEESWCVQGFFSSSHPFLPWPWVSEAAKATLGSQCTLLTAVPSVVSVPLQWWSLFGCLQLHVTCWKKQKKYKNKFETSEEPFYLPLTGWSNGNFLGKKNLRKDVLDSPSLQIFKSNWTWYWACSSWPLSKQRGWTETFQRYLILCNCSWDLHSISLHPGHPTQELCISILHTATGAFSVTEGSCAHVWFQSATIKLINMKNQRQTMQDTQEN